MNKKLKDYCKLYLCKKDWGDYKEEWYEFDEDELNELISFIVEQCSEVLDTKIAPASHPFNSLGYKLIEHFGSEEL